MNLMEINLRDVLITQKAEAKRKDTCSIGPTPEINHDSKDDSKPDIVNPDESISVEEGDQILATGLFLNPSEEI